MEFSLLFTFFIFVGIYSLHFSKAKEPLCSIFSYEEQLLEKMIRTEIKVEMMVNEIKTTQDNVLNTLEDIKQIVAEFSDKFVDLKENITEEMIKKGDEIEQKDEAFKKLFDETKSNLTSAVDDQRKTLIQLQGKLERPSIAFYAHHVTDRILDKTDEVIIFDKTFINEGMGYDSSTGIFKAPIGGLYQFVVHICTAYNKFAFIGLILEDNVIAADSTHDDDSYTCSSVGAIVRVKSGETVWVKSTWSASNRQLDEDTYKMNTFSGMLVNN